MLLVRHSQEVPHGFAARRVRWPAWPLHRVPDPWPVVLGERAARRLAGGGVFHAVQPALVPPGPAVVTCHDLIPSFFPEYLAGAGRSGQALAYRHFLRRLAGARLVLTPSQETAGDVVDRVGVDPGRVRVVPWGATRGGDPGGPGAGGALRALLRGHRAPQERRARGGGDRPRTAGRPAGDDRGLVGRGDSSGCRPPPRGPERTDGWSGWGCCRPGGSRRCGRGRSPPWCPRARRGSGCRCWRRWPPACRRWPATRPPCARWAGTRPPSCRRTTPGRGPRPSRTLASDPALRRARAEAGRARAGDLLVAGRGGGRGGRPPGRRRMTLVVVDCHMVGQAAAGDAGNGRYAATLLAAMAATAPEGDAWRRWWPPRRARGPSSPSAPPSGCPRPTCRGWPGPPRGRWWTRGPMWPCSPTSRPGGARAPRCWRCTTRPS